MAWFELSVMLAAMLRIDSRRSGNKTGSLVRRLRSVIQARDGASQISQ